MFFMHPFFLLNRLILLYRMFEYNFLNVQCVRLIIEALYVITMCSRVDDIG